MPPDEPSFFSRDELLGGLPARRASTILFAIEARSAHLVARSKRAMAWYETPRTSSERETAFLEAMAGGRALPLTPRVQDLERFAPTWADLVPAGADLRASLARLIGQKYRFTPERVPRMRAALGLDDPEVVDAFQRLHDKPPSSIYAPSVTARERLRWLRSKTARGLEELPAFWAAYALAFTETVGEGILALPIALAPVGPLPGIVFLVVLGAVNILTIGGLAEAITRNGDMRYGSSYFGRLASALLGRGGSAGITVALFAFNVITFLAYLLAFAAPLADATGVHVGVWAAVLFAVNLFFLRRELDATVASAMVIGVVNVGLIVAISAIALAHADAENLRFARIPFVGDDPADAAALGLVFGVTLVAYFGHTSAGNVAKVILKREPTGRALFWGNAAAVCTVIAIYSLAVLGINGAVPAEDLVGYDGTALEPLADVAGPSVNVLGSIYVILAIGLGSVYVSLGLFNQVREWLPRKPGGSSTLGRRWSAFAASDRGGFLVAIVPVVLVFLALEWLVLIDAASLTEPLSLIGVLAVPLLGGVFPMLLLAAARRRGEFVPASGVRVLRGPIAIGAVATLFFAGLLVQGLVIWQRPGERIAVAVVTVVMAAITWRAARGGAFRPRAVIELRREPSGEGSTAVTIGGERPGIPVDLTLRDGEHRTSEGHVRIERFGDVRDASIKLPATVAVELKVWIHAITPDGDSEPVTAVVRLRADDAAEAVEHRPDDGVLLVPMDGTPMSVAITPAVAER